MGIRTKALGRLKYTMPEEVGIRSQDLDQIDSIAYKAIRDSATPGCQVLVAKDGKVIYYKSFGYQTYDSTLPVQNTDLYDLASLTKIVATTPGIMHLYDNKEFGLENTVSDYIPGLDSAVIHNAKMADILTHQAGFRPFIPFYLQTMPDSIYSVCYKNKKDSTYCIEIRKDLFMRKDYRDTMYKEIYEDTLKPSQGYVYSDLGFYLLKQICESLAKDSFQHYLDTLFYKPLGMSTMGFNPLNRFPLKRIPPTENDTVFRKTLVHGYVHDPGAAMLGGISGHAGLFSDGNDLAIYMQMLLNKGEYAGHRYLSASTVKLFTDRYSDRDRRGLGFDKPETDRSKGNPAGDMASPLAFGHQGFTGTCVWADPKNNVIFVFLSNRVYPDAENKKLVRTGVRTHMQDVVYKAIQRANRYVSDKEK
jgi:CubicO group peptidase (beta-lactamase class C family)